MRITFSPDEWNQITLREVPRRKFCSNYLEERDRLWSTRLESCRRAGKDLWNGEIYTIEDILQLDETRIVMHWSTCEYKDVVVRMQMGVEAVVARYGAEHVPRFLTLDCLPVTRDGKFVYGERGATTAVSKGAIGLIGGTLNRDEMKVVGMGDIATYMRMEMAEETAIDVKATPLRLFSLNYFRGKYEFLYTCRLPVHSSEIHTLHKPGEFSRLIAVDEAQARSGAYKATDAFRFSWTYLAELLAFDLKQA